jgi:TolB-like protein/Tfp pilus assembly protein PilF
MAGNEVSRSSSSHATPPGEVPRRRLDLWKEIASYLNRSEKTVRRWEESEGLPVHRLLHEKRSSVYAFTDELDAWLKSRNLQDGANAEPPDEQPCDLEQEMVIAEPEKQRHPEIRGPTLEDQYETGSQASGEPRTEVAVPSRPLQIALVIGVLIFIGGILAAIYGAGFRTSMRQTSSPAHIHSLAVLPLENLSGDSEQEYFADGMTAELITELGKISSIRVISRTSVMQYKGVRKPLAQIARELHVDAVIEGEVLRSNDRVRVTAQLIDTAEDRHIWAEAYDRDLRDVVALQGDVARSIASAIRAKVTPAELARITPARRVDPKAHEDYLRARYFMDKRTAEAMNTAVNYFQQAIQREPEYAQAYAGLATTYVLLGNYELLPPEKSYPLAIEFAAKALELDDTLSEAYSTRATAAYSYEFNWAEAELDFRRAIALDPSSAFAHHQYGEYFASVGKAELAISEIKIARELDPLSLPLMSTLGRMYREAHHYDEAVQQCKQTLVLDPNFSMGHWCLGQAYLAKRQFLQATLEIQRANELGTTPLIVCDLGCAYAFSGKKSEARAILNSLKQKSQFSYVSPYLIASIYSALGEKDEAFQWLKKADDRRDGISYLLADPMMDPLRSDPRFALLVQRLQIPK